MGSSEARRQRNRHSLKAGARDVAPILIGIVPFGLVAGAAVIQAGFGVAEAVGQSLLVNAGASQIVATTLFGTGAPLWLALGTALIVNARMFIYSTSIAPVLADAPGWLRPILGHMLVDQNYASTMTKGRFRDDVNVVATTWARGSRSPASGSSRPWLVPCSAPSSRHRGASTSRYRSSSSRCSLPRSRTAPQ